MKKALPTILGLLSMLALSIPALQQSFGFMKVKGLNGVTEPDTAKLSYSWWDRGLQERIESYSTDSLSLRPACVRARNQFEFTFFDKLNAKDIYEYDGIFYRMYFLNYTDGANFAGYERIRSDVATLKRFGDSLKKRNVPLYFVIAPSKLHLYRGNLPWWNSSSGTNTNYIRYKQAMLQAGINVLDADQWLGAIRETTKPSVMATGGVHWSLYGSALVCDSLIKRVSLDRRESFARIVMKPAPADAEINREDMDAANLCNLMFPPKDPKLRNVVFPEVRQAGRKLRPLVIADSFYGTIAWSGITPQVTHDKAVYYYYFKTRQGLREVVDPKVTVQAVDADLAEADCVIIMSDIFNMENFAFGFIRDYLRKKGF
jgi:hypothetical protein